MGSTIKTLFFLFTFDSYKLFSLKLIKFWKVKPTIKRYYVIFLRMLKTKTRKLQSNQKLNTKLNYIAQGETSPEFIKKADSFILQDKKELQAFNLNTNQANENQDEHVLNFGSEKSKPKLNQNIKLQQIQKKVNQREELRKTKGLAVKMKIKLQDQIKTSITQLEEKETQQKQIQSEIQMLQNLSRQRTKHCEDIANNQQMLRFKESQLANLNTIHSEILQSSKKELTKQKLLKLQNQQKLLNAKKRLKICRDKWNDTQNRIGLIQQLTIEKLRLQKLFENQKKADQEKLQLKADAIREVVEEIIKKNKRVIQDECEWKSRIIREKSHAVKNIPHFKLTLQKSGVPTSSYYTFTQLKGVKQLNFKINKQAEKIFQIFENEVNPKIIQINQHYEESKELLQLKTQMKKLQDETVQAEQEFKLKQAQIQQLEMRRNNLVSSVGDMKKKSQIK